jgi:hypothetical protein
MSDAGGGVTGKPSNHQHTNSLDVGNSDTPDVYQSVCCNGAREQGRLLVDVGPLVPKDSEQ